MHSRQYSIARYTLSKMLNPTKGTVPEQHKKMEDVAKQETQFGIHSRLVSMAVLREIARTRRHAVVVKSEIVLIVITLQQWHSTRFHRKDSTRPML